MSAVALFNSFQTYTTLALTQRVYSARPQEVTLLSSRTFGTWTLLSAIVRVYAAYNIANRAVYDICVWSYVIAGAHFFSEWLVFRTTRYVFPYVPDGKRLTGRRLGPGLTGPLLVSSLSIWWMITQREFYTAA